MSEVRSNFTTLEVDDEKYICTLYSATTSLEILTRISKHVGEPLGKIFGGDAEEEKGLDARLEAVLPGVLKALADRLDRAETVSLIKDILNCLQVTKGEITSKVSFDEQFRGRIGHMFKLAMAVLKFQFGDLGNAFGGSGGMQSILKSLKQ